MSTSESSEPQSNPQSNIPEFTVCELAFSLKKTIEDNYGRVRVRGELSRVSIAASGHMYSSIKDDKAVIDAICWKGVMSKMTIKPEEGLEVICTGKLSTYPSRSNYQLIIESMELAGEGALLKMLEERKKKLTAEGLFAEDRKRPLPFLPETIGVITSPTGAVIRDILHRLSDRFPRHVIVWPALVQGDNAADQITTAINGFQTIDEQGNFPKPDLLIIARGGGSLEDLMPFNEENVVRAVANSQIPIISAVGHETDTTLCDYAADLRAPTPTGAAEMAVPVRANLMAQILDDEKRLLNALTRQLSEASHRLQAQAKGLGDPTRLLEIKTQKLDHAADKIMGTYKTYITHKQNQIVQISSRLPSPKQRLQNAAQNLDRWADGLSAQGQKLCNTAEKRLTHASQMLEAYSFENVLQRGFAVIRDTGDQIITTAQAATDAGAINIQFAGGEHVSAVASKNISTPTTAKTPKPKPKPKSKKTPPKSDDAQRSLF